MAPSSLGAHIQGKSWGSHPRRGGFLLLGSFLLVDLKVTEFVVTITPRVVSLTLIPVHATTRPLLSHHSLGFASSGVGPDPFTPPTSGLPFTPRIGDAVPLFNKPRQSGTAMARSDAAARPTGRVAAIGRRGPIGC